MPIRRHVRGLGLSYVQTLADDTYHAYHQDEQGSTAYVTGSKGGTENLYSYDAFGNLQEKKEGIENRILYTGQQYDQETEQYYLRARYYNPTIGRFTQEDTYRGDGLNLYAYCANNPVIYYDPSGHNSNLCEVPSTTEPEIPPANGGIGGGNNPVKTDFIVSPNGIVVDANINASSIPETQFTVKKLQHEDKHAGDFGITGNWNKSKSVEYQQAIESHISSATDIFVSKYKGNDVYVYFNSSTQIGAYVDYQGSYVGGWKFSQNQINYHMNNGIKLY